MAITVDGNALGVDWEGTQDELPVGAQPDFALAANLLTATAASGTSVTTPTITPIRPRQTIFTLTLVDDGTDNMTTQTGLATTGGSGSGLTVDVTAAAGVATAVVPNAQGDGLYRLGELITVAALESGADDPITFRITEIK